MLKDFFVCFSRLSSFAIKSGFLLSKCVVCAGSCLCNCLGTEQLI